MIKFQIYKLQFTNFNFIKKLQNYPLFAIMNILKHLCLVYAYFYISFSIQVSIISTNNMVSATTNHIFLIQGYGDFIIAGTYLEIQYDSLWTLTSSTGRDPTKDYCDTGCNISTVNFNQTSNKITLNGLFPDLINVDDYYAVKYTIKNIINPSKVYTQTFDIKLFMSDGTQYNFASTTITVAPAIMSCTAVPNNPQISNITQYQFTVTPSISLPSTGYIVATFPSQCSDSSQKTVLISPNCSNSLGIINCSLLTSASMKLTNLSTVSGPSPLAFNITGVRNPAHLGINQQLSLSYYTSSNQLMSRCTVQIGNLTPKSLTNVSFTLNCNASGSALGVLLFTVTQIPKQTDKMVLTLPAEIYVSDIVRVFLSTGADMNTTNKEVNIQSKTLSSSKIAFFPFKVQALNNFRVAFSTLRCPPTIKSTNNISIEIVRMGTVITTHQCCNITSSLPAFQSASVYFQNNRMALITNYRFYIQLNQTIGTGTYISKLQVCLFLIFRQIIQQLQSGSHYIDFIFPSSYNLVVGNNYTCYIQGYTQPSNTLCRVQSATQISLSLVSGNLSLIMSNLKSISISASLQLYITLIGMRNPSSSSVSFDVYLSDSSHNRLQGSTGISYSISSALISGISISPSTYKVFNLTSYTFRINNTNPLGLSSILRIKFPSQIKLQSPVCKINGSLAAGCNQTAVGSRDQILITLPNVAMAQYNLYSYIISIENVRNPESFQITDSFQFQLQSNGSILQGIYEGQSISMNQTNTLFINISLLNNTVFQHTEYTINYNFAMNFNSSKQYRLKVILPSDFKIYSCADCTSYAQFALNASSGFLKLTQVQNPIKTMISANIAVELYIDRFLSLQTTYSLLSFASLVQDFTVSFSNNIMGKSATYWITGYYLRQQMKQIAIQLPSQISIGALNISCQQCQISSFSQTSKLLRIVLNKLQGQNVTFRITGIINPLSYPSSAFTFRTYSSDSVLISQSVSTSKFFTIICSSTCATCDSVNSSKCSSCYQNSLVNTLKYYHYTAFTCLNSCLTTQFQVGNICYPCDIKCNTCSKQPNNCTSCSGLSNLFNNRCLLNCPQLYFNQSNTCNPCIPLCLTCTSSLICTYCVPGKVLRPDGSCQDTCVNSYYNKSNICVQCPSNCILCDISGCSSCNSTYYLINSTCVDKCPFGYFIDLTSLRCQLCQPPCKYCQGKSDNCTGCDKLSIYRYYLNNQCMNSCLATYYTDQNFICRKCVSPCLNCYSQTNCTSCDNGYLFYSPTNQCFLTCINKTIQIGTQCVQCLSPCLQCSLNTNNCTSCIQNYFLDQSLFKCNATCNFPYKAIDRICRQCVTPCLGCLPNQPYKCTSCISGYKLLQNNCYQTCPSTTYANASQCKSCNSGCYECSLTSATCTSCYPGTYLYLNSCIPGCPADYFQYQNRCTSCQLPCQTCLRTPYQCKTCNSTTDYWNPITLNCTVSCLNPYFQVIVDGINQCKKCQIPCKTCSTAYDKCSSCVAGKYLVSQNCIDNCPDLFYSQNNTCFACPILCQKCTQYKCTQCKSGNLLYKQSCYFSCPSQAPYPYGSYCRNCLKDDCLFCNSNNQCVMCFQTFYLLDGSCYSSCPQSYQPDALTQLACIKTSQKALFEYLKIKQKSKIFIFPGSIILGFILLSIIIFPGSNITGSFSLVSIAQNLTTIILIYFYVTYSQVDLVIGSTIPYAILILVCVISIIVSCVFLYKSVKQYMRDEEFIKWYQYGSNQKRVKLILILSVLNFKLTKFLFSGFLKLPFTSFQFKDKTLLKYQNWIIGLWIAFYNLPIFIISVYIILIQKVYLLNSKLFFSALDSILVQLVSIIVTSIYVYNQPQIPEKYKKFILQGVSNQSIYPISQQNQYIGNQQNNDVHLYHSNSVEDIKESKQMKQVDFKSVFDPSDFQDPPNVDPKQLENALKKGQFRTKQKPKKKGKGKYKLDQLQMIQQEISDQQQKINDKKKKLKNKKKNDGMMNNYIYWKPPKQKKNKAEQIFKQNRRQIMKKIYEKQSQFDTITNNDIIFMQQSDQQSQRRKNQYSDNLQQSQNNYESKRQLNPKIKNQYSTLFNLNYAKRKHLQ